MKIEAFHPDHLEALALQQPQAYLQVFFTREYGEQLAAGEVASTIRVGEQLVACFGIAHVDGIGRVLWSFLSQCAKDHLLGLYRYWREFVREHEQPWLFATTEQGFAPGERLLRMLGFSLIDVLEGYGPDQCDHLLFVKLGGQP